MGYATIHGWLTAVQNAHQELDVKGFHAAKQGSTLYKDAAFHWTTAAQTARQKLGPDGLMGGERALRGGRSSAMA